MKSSTAWLRGNTRQDVYIKGRSVVTMSSTSRSSYSVEKKSIKHPEGFVVGESLVGGEEVVGI